LVPFTRLLKKEVAVWLVGWFTFSEAIRRLVMRGEDKRTGELFSYVDLKKRVRSYAIASDFISSTAC
jgi:hypothetical protein